MYIVSSHSPPNPSLDLWRNVAKAKEEFDDAFMCLMILAQRYRLLILSGNGLNRLLGNNPHYSSLTAMSERIFQPSTSFYVRRLWLILFLVVLVGVPSRSKAQALPVALTGAALKATVEGVVSSLREISPTLGGNIGTVMAGSANDMNNLLVQFNSALGANVNVPLVSLGADVQELGRRLYVATNQLNILLTTQRNCLFANMSQLAAGVNNIISHTKESIPLISEDSPRVDYFQYDGHNPGIVPLEGGRLTIFGYRLWEAEPTVRIMDENRSTILTELASQRGRNDDEISVVVPGSTVTENAGRSLQIQVIPRTIKKFIFINTGVRDLEPVFLPMAIAKEYDLKYKVRAWIAYKCTREVEKDLPPISIYHDNGSCEGGRQINQFYDLRGLPENTKSVTFKVNIEGITRNAHDVNYSWSGQQMHATGSIDRAKCGRFGFIAKLIATTVYSATVIPHVRYDETVERTNGPYESVTAAELPFTSTNLLLPRECSSTPTTVWYEIVPITNGKESSAIYTSPRFTAHLNPAGDDGAYRNIILHAQYNPVVVDGRTQLSVTVTAPSCGF